NMEDKPMRIQKLFAAYLLAVLLLATVPFAGLSETPAVDTSDGYYDIDIFLVGENAMSTVSQTVSPGITPGTQGETFEVGLESVLAVKGAAFGTKYGFNFTAFRVVSASQVTEKLDVELRQDNTLIASGNVEVAPLAAQNYDVQLVFSTGFGPEHVFTNGAIMKVTLKGNVRLGLGPQGYGVLEMRTKSIPDISTETRDSLNQITETFHVNQWPSKTVNVTGEITAAFGAQDIASVSVAIRKGEPLQSSGAASRAGLIYWYVWSYTNAEAGTYTYNVTVTDAKGNAYVVSGSFEMLDKGLLLTSPSQDKEGVGVAGGNRTTTGTAEYTVNVRNVGASSANAVLSLTGSNANYAALSGGDLSGVNNDTLQNIPPGGHKSLKVNVSGNAVLGTTLLFTLNVVSDSITYSLQFEIKIVALRGIELTPGGTVYLYPTETKNQRVTIKNLSPEVEDTFTVSFSTDNGAGWTIGEPEKKNYTLGPEQSEIIIISLTAPLRSDIPDEGIELALDVLAVSRDHTDVTATARLSAKAVRGVQIITSPSNPSSADPNSRTELKFNIKNQYDQMATFSFSCTTPAGWPGAPTVTPSTRILDAFGEVSVTIRMEPTLSTIAGNYQFTLTARKDVDENVFTDRPFTIRVTETRLYSFGFLKEEYVGTVAGERSTLAIPVEVTNRGNSEGRINLVADVRLEGSEESTGWSISYRDSSSITPPPQGSGIVLNVDVVVPRDAKPGTYLLHIEVQDTNGNELPITAQSPTSVYITIDDSFGEMAGIAISELWIHILLLFGVFGMAVFAKKKLAATM
ncbi:MAG: hypothetical protein QCI38_03140, partial [Candidatus Thermoplasmatota archaeon]|nr:hypothetical protein [Candidatus Thermoplasmatota archaeon]